MAIKFVIWLAGLTNKATPDDADELYVRQASDNTSHSTTWANIKTALGSIFAKTGAIGSSGLTVGTGRLVGRGTAETGPLEEITLGTNLSLTGNTLNAAGGGGTPGGLNTQVQFNDGGVFGGDSGLTFSKTTKALGVGGATVTTSNPVLNLSQTWNAGAVTFAGIKSNITDTASATASLLVDLQVGGVTKASIDKSGNYTQAGPQIKLAASTGANVNFVNGANNATNGVFYFGSADGNFWSIGAGTNTPVFQSHSANGYISGGTPWGSAGHPLRVQGGNGTGPSGNLNGGNLILTGGSPLNSGTKGIVTASRLRADGFATATAAKTADYTATLDDGTIEVDASGVARTITLFAASGNAGKIIVVKKTDSSANAVTIDGNAVETIDGAATTVLSTQWAFVMLQVNAAGTAWIKI